MIWLLVLVVLGLAAIFGPGWVEAQEQITLADLLKQLSGERYLENSVCVKTGKDEHSSMHAATLNQPLFTFYNYGDRFVKFIITIEERLSSEPRNAFVILMRPKSAEHLPPKHDPIHNNKQLLFNDICSVLLNKRVGFMHDEIEGVGHRFVQVLTDALWCIDGQYHKFESRCKHAKVPPIPNMFLKFNKGSENNKGGYNDWTSKKRKPPQLDRKELMELGNRIITIVSHPRLCTAQWGEVRREVEGLEKSLRGYAEDMEDSANRSKERHSSQQLLRCPDLNTESRDISASKVPMKPVYAKLMGILEDTEFYCPILVDKNLSSTDKYARYRFFNNLELPCCVHLFIYHAGSQLGNICYVWKIPSEVKDRCSQKYCAAIAKVKSELPVYMSRAMRKEFLDRYEHVKKITPAVLRSMYHFLTDDCTSELQNADIDKRLELMLDDPDVDLVVDRRELNPGRRSHFEAFWKGVDALLEEYGKAVDDRRHGPDVAHLPIAISISDLIKKVAEKLPSGTPIPSEPWVRFQTGFLRLLNITIVVLMSSTKFRIANFENHTSILDIVLSFCAT